MLSRLMGHDHEGIGQAILVLDEAGEESLGTESEALEQMLGRLLADRHPRPELLQPPRPRNRKSHLGGSPRSFEGDLSDLERPG